MPCIFGALSVDLILWQSRRVEELLQVPLQRDTPWTDIIDGVSWLKAVLELTQTLLLTSQNEGWRNVGLALQRNLLYHIHGMLAPRKVFMHQRFTASSSGPACLRTSSVWEVAAYLHALSWLIKSYGRALIVASKKRNSAVKATENSDEEDDLVERRMDYKEFLVPYGHEAIAAWYMALLDSGMVWEAPSPILPTPRLAQSCSLTLKQQAAIGHFMSDLYPVNRRLYHRFSVLNILYVRILWNTHGLAPSLCEWAKEVVKDMVRWIRSDPRAMVLACFIQNDASSKSASAVVSLHREEYEGDEVEEETMGMDQLPYLSWRLARYAQHIKDWLPGQLIMAAAALDSTAGTSAANAKYVLDVNAKIRPLLASQAALSSLLSAVGFEKSLAGKKHIWSLKDGLSPGELIDRSEKLQTSLNEALQSNALSLHDENQNSDNNDGIEVDREDTFIDNSEKEAEADEEDKEANKKIKKQKVSSERKAPPALSAEFIETDSDDLLQHDTPINVPHEDPDSDDSLLP